MRIAFIAATEGNLGAAGSGRAGVAALRSGRAQTAVARLSAAGAATSCFCTPGRELPPPEPAPRGPRALLRRGRRKRRDRPPSAPARRRRGPPGVPIVYGTGNFLFPMYYPYVHPEWHEGYLVQLAFSGRGSAG